MNPWEMYKKGDKVWFAWTEKVKGATAIKTACSEVAEVSDRLVKFADRTRATGFQVSLPCGDHALWRGLAPTEYGAVTKLCHRRYEAVSDAKQMVDVRQAELDEVNSLAARGTWGGE